MIKHATERILKFLTEKSDGKYFIISKTKSAARIEKKGRTGIRYTVEILRNRTTKDSKYTIGKKTMTYFR
jgi:hypothetical protein